METSLDSVAVLLLLLGLTAEGLEHAAVLNNNAAMSNGEVKGRLTRSIEVVIVLSFLSDWHLFYWSSIYL